jgi:hypothetical protein
MAVTSGKNPSGMRRCGNTERIPNQSACKEATMATHKRSGSHRATQPSPEAFASKIPKFISQSTRIAESAASLNRGFDQVLNEIRTLRKLGLLGDGGGSPDFVKICRLMVEELRAWAIAELTQDINDCANLAGNRWGIRRSPYEERFRDPKDVLREAERMKKRLAAEAGKAKQAKQQNQ